MRHLGKMQATLALLITLGFFGAFAMVYLLPAPDGIARDAVLILIGALGARWGSVVDWHFGSSAGSAQKTAALVAEPVHTVTPAAVPPRKEP